MNLNSKRDFYIFINLQFATFLLNRTLKMTLNVKQKRINPDSTPSISKSFIDKSMSSNTDKSEEEDVFDDDGEVIPRRS